MSKNRFRQLSRPFWAFPVFWIGLVLKLAAASFFASAYLTDLFIPFVNRFVVSGFQNPWNFFYQTDMVRMFPYPPAMLWIMAIPRILFAPFLSPDWTAVTWLHLFSARLPLLAFDILLFYLLLRLFPVHQKKVVFIYWLSPIVFFINYVHGQLDIIPTALFFLSVCLILDRRYLPAFLVLAFATATKSHLFIAWPFLFVYLYKQRVRLISLVGYALLLTTFYGLLLAPYAGSEAFRTMVFHSPEQQKLFAFAIALTPSFSLVICPTVITLVFFKFASYKKLNREILLMFLGIVFACLVIFVPPMPGWFLWSLPFLIYFYASNKEYSRAPFIFYNVVYLLYFIFFFEKEFNLPVEFINVQRLTNLALSVTMASIAFIALWMFRLGIQKNEELKIKEAPLLIGIGGDSGSGKHTLYNVLKNLVGRDQSIPIFGDNFHKWERGNEMWNVYTHLNPASNKLHEGVDTTIALKDGHSIEMGCYNHETGTFTDARRLEPNKFIFFIGLHPFYLKRMRELIPIKIFLDPDESLRRFWKIRRDVKERGHDRETVMRQIETRQEDGGKFIKPQAQFADLVIRMEPVAPLDLENPDAGVPQLRARYLLDNSINLYPLVSLLSRVSSLQTELIPTVHSQELIVSGTVSSRTVAETAYNLNLNFDELSIRTNRWLRNYHGISQLLFLMLYHEKMEAR